MPSLTTRISDSLGIATELRAKPNYTAPAGTLTRACHGFQARNSTPSLLTPGEVMQLPADEEIVMISGQLPVKAKKLRYFEDKIFSGRVLLPPGLKAGGPFLDRPTSRSDDWIGVAHCLHADLSELWFDHATGEHGDDGELKRHPILVEEEPTSSAREQLPDAGLFDDEFDPSDAKRLMLLKRNATVRRAHSVDQVDDDLLPNF